MMETREHLPVPDNCAVRLIDLEPSVDGLLSVDEEGFVNIYINAGLSRDRQLKALDHELRHYYRGDLYSDADIREVERLADGPVVLDIHGAPLPNPAPAFAPEGLRAVGRGLYVPVGENRARADVDLARVRGLLQEACKIYDVKQMPPLVPVSRLEALAEGLCADDLAFIAWQPEGSALAVALRFYRERGDKLHGALYYDRRGRLDNALAAFELENTRITVDLRRVNTRLSIHSLGRGAGGVPPLAIAAATCRRTLGTID